DDADIRPVYDEEPMAEVQLTHESLKSRQHGQFLEEKSNEAKVENDIHVIESINIELEHKVAKLLKENEHLKARIQEKVFATAALNNKLRKLTGSSVDTKFAKPSILGKPHLKPLRNQSVVRQLTAFKSKGPQFLKSRVAFQVDVKNDLSKPVIPHYWPKVRESAFAKPPHVIASSESRNSSKNMSSSNQKKYLSSNDMVHNYYLVEARKKTQDKNKNSKTSVIPSAKLKHTANGSKPKLRSTNQITRNWPASKSSCVTITAVHIANHSRNSRSFSDSKHFVCLTCQKCIFNVSHDACITKLLKEVNSHAKKQSHKTRNKNKPVEQKSHTQKLEWRISTGQKFSPNKTYAVYEKTTSPRSCLRWKPKGRIFKTVGLRWIPTGKIVGTCINTNDSAIPLGKKTCTPNIVICANFSSQIAVTNGNPSSVNNKQHRDIGTAVEYQKATLASLDVSALDKPHFKLENLSRRFIS
ncbi:hypothetical protein Tco_1186696, partial [Tanacetum coccineum]